MAGRCGMNAVAGVNTADQTAIAVVHGAVYVEAGDIPGIDGEVHPLEISGPEFALPWKHL